MWVIATIITWVLFVVVRITERKWVRRPFCPLFRLSSLAQCSTLRMVMTDMDWKRYITSDASSASCRTSWEASVTCGFGLESCILIGWAALFSRRWQHFLQHVVLLCQEILYFDWLVNWLGNWVLEGGALGVYPKKSTYTHTHTHTHARQTR